MQLIGNITKTLRAKAVHGFGFIKIFFEIYLYNCSIDAGLQSRKPRAPVRDRLAPFPQVGATGCRTTQGILNGKKWSYGCPNSNVTTAQLEVIPRKGGKNFQKTNISNIRPQKKERE